MTIWLMSMALLGTAVSSGSLGSGSVVALDEPSTVGFDYQPVSPFRVLDTRKGLGAEAGPVGPGGVVDLLVAGIGGLPSTDVGAVVLNVTATAATAPTFVTVWPTGEERPVASSVNVVPGRAVSNHVVAKVGAGGRVSLFNAHGSVELVADVVGWLPELSVYDDSVPTRILDTRSGLGANRGPLGPDRVVELQVTGAGPVPDGNVGAVVLNVTAAAATAPTFVTVWPTGEDRPGTSSINLLPGQTVPNLVISKVGADGTVSLFNRHGETHLIADVVGWLPESSPFRAMLPERVADTRSLGRPIAGGETLDVEFGSVPDAATAVVVNVTITQPTASTFVTAFPTGSDRPVASTLNALPGDTRAHLTIAKLGDDGSVSFYNAFGSAHLVVDLVGWIEPQTWPMSLSFTPRPGATVTEPIGSDGGTITGSGFELDVPAGALTGRHSITVTPGTAIDGTTFDDDLVTVYEFGPDGLQFMQPATLTIELPPGTGDGLIAFGFAGDGADVHLVPFVRHGNTVTIELSHFSGAGIAAAGSAQQIPYTSSAGLVAAGDVRAYLEQIAATGQPLDTAPIVAAFEKWWDRGLRPALADAKARPLQQLQGSQQNRAEAWIAEALDFGALAQMLGVDDQLDADWLGESVAVAEAALAAANDACVGGSDAAIARQYGTVLDWQAALSQAGEDVAVGLDDCAELQITSATVPSVLDPNTSGEGTFRTRLKFLGTNGGSRYDLPVDVSVTATGGTVSAVQQSGDGWVTFDIGQGTTDTDVTAEATYSPPGSNGAFTFETSEEWTVASGTSLTLSAADTGIDPGGSTSLTATLRNTDGPIADITVTFETTGDGTIGTAAAQTGNDGSAWSSYTAPDSAGQATVTARATVDGIDYVAEVTIAHGTSIELSPTTVTIGTGDSVGFTATAFNLTPATVTWSATCGTVQSTGDLTATYTAPGAADTCTVTATATSDNTIQASAEVTVEEPGLDLSALVGHWYGTQREQFCGDDITTPSWAWIHQDDGRYILEVPRGGSFYAPRPGEELSIWYMRRFVIDESGPVSYLGVRRIYSDGRGDVLSDARNPDLPVDGDDEYLVQHIGGTLTIIEIDLSHEGRWDDCPLARWTHTLTKDTERDPFGDWAFPE